MLQETRHLQKHSIISECLYIQTKDLLNKLRFVDCLTDIQTTLVERRTEKSRRLGEKNEDLLHLVRSVEDSKYSAFVQRLRESKQTICARVTTNGGGLGSTSFLTKVTKPLK